ncbi:MAG TPA: glycosyltransferase family 4 protein [Dehalococcoidia bacterium]|nr:glycosyltransferase family 4 protein [Dehalococcoidia bacterium]
MAVLVTTVEKSGIDRYSQELAKRIAVPTVETRRYLSIPEVYSLLHRLRHAGQVVHFPSQHFGRYGLLLGRPFIITVHDLVRICFPFSKESLPERVGLRLDVLGLRRATHIIAVSASTKADLVSYLGIPEARISVIYNGVDCQVFKPMPGRRLPFPYLLYVGSERPRKNLGTLLTAFATLKSQASAPPDLKLVKVGIAGRSDEFRRATLGEVARLGLGKDVIFAEYVSDEELSAYYSSAIALVMPSLYEGFGLPLVEAMACGCPVIASDRSSLPEVAGDAALFVDPGDSQGLAQLMHRIITEPALREKLIEKGFKRVQRFSWDRTAQETLQVYHKVEAEVGIPVTK